jgi:hypothetical protein
VDGFSDDAGPTSDAAQTEDAASVAEDARAAADAPAPTDAPALLDAPVPADAPALAGPWVQRGQPVVGVGQRGNFGRIPRHDGPAALHELGGRLYVSAGRVFELGDDGQWRWIEALGEAVGRCMVGDDERVHVATGGGYSFYMATRGRGEAAWRSALVSGDAGGRLGMSSCAILGGGLYVASPVALHLSKDRGETWTSRWNMPSTPAAYTWGLVATDTALLRVLQSSGGPQFLGPVWLERLTDEGRAAERISLALGTGFVSMAAAGGAAWVAESDAQGTRLFRSDDDGRTFAPGGPAPPDVRALAWDPVGRALIVGGRSVFVSTDGGRTFGRITAPLPVGSLATALLPRPDRIVVGILDDVGQMRVLELRRDRLVIEPATLP